MAPDPQQLALFSAESTVAAFASVVVDIPARALSEPYAYGVPGEFADDIAIGSTVLVTFGHRAALGYVVALAETLGDLPGAEGLDPVRVRPVRALLAAPSCSPYAADIAFWLSREYVAPLAECLRLFLPPGGTPRLVRDADGAYRVERPAVAEVHERVLSLTDAGRTYEPPVRAHRQRQLLEALACGPVTTRELRALYTDLSATIRTLAQKGVVAVEERRAWRGVSGATTLSSASASVPEHLTDGQREALAAIAEAYARGQGDVVLIDGVTGSGKTEVYLAAIERVLADGRSACVLVPEISLTAQTVGRFRSRFGDAVAVFHSRLSAGERLDQWDMVRTGAARVVVGARSALFCPFRDLGLIVIDEEHEQSYKQGSSPRYHAREVAAEMARRGGFPLVLGSATPSAEALERCRAGTWAAQRWQRVEMRERPGGARLPRVVVADLRRAFAGGNRSMFSSVLERALLDVAARKEKAVLLHNRRGFAPFLMCRECGCVPTCRHCSTALTYHERTHTLECHTCGAVYHVRPYPAPGSACPQCGSRYLAKMGLGTQQVEDALRALLPSEVAVIRMDADSTKGKDGHQRLLEAFDAAESAVLLGTQMIAKGLDFPEVTLVGVINADYALKMPDFRAGERAFDLLEQVAGRAGRGERPGEVIIQTYLPEDPVIRAVATHDRAIFTEHDRAQRAEALYPPFVRLSNINVWARDEHAAEGHAAAIACDIRRLVAATAPVPPPAGDAGAPPSLAEGGDPRVAPVVLGPNPCVIARAKDRYRFHVVIKSPLGYHISDVIAAVLDARPAPQGVTVGVDIDAYDLM
ncbi:replication restart helicase PriA [Collinsella intestinalis]|uniref:replication restart helicase PriA n=1 Tax=Collinsella intestinalis TaxID=147207 RepID=UPI0019581610|nr:primosomal protein N' [Collinsella intestinalis]MBM6908703.1 primosomal protein N' [Collinsella intestinalis]